MTRSSDNIILKAEFTNDCSFTRALYQGYLRQQWLLYTLAATIATVIILYFSYSIAQEGDITLALWIFAILGSMSLAIWQRSWMYWKDLWHPLLDIKEDVFEVLSINPYSSKNFIRRHPQFEPTYLIHLQQKGQFTIPERIVVSLPPQTPIYVIRTGYTKLLLEIRPQSKTTT